MCCGSELDRCFFTKGCVEGASCRCKSSCTSKQSLVRCPAVLQAVMNCLTLLRSTVLCRRGAQRSWWLVTPHRDFVTSRWENMMSPCRGTCQADAVLGEVFSGNLWGTGGITVVQNLLQPVFKELWSQDPVLGA